MFGITTLHVLFFVFKVFCVCVHENNYNLPQRVNTVLKPKDSLEYPPILFIADCKSYMERMDRQFFDEADAYINASDGKSSVWGAGFDGYDLNLTLKNNIINRFGSVSHFSAMMIFPWYSKNSKLNGEIKDVSDELIVILKDNECRKASCVKDIIINMTDVKIILLTYAKEVAQLSQVLNINNYVVVHTPMTASVPVTYCPVDHENRNLTAILAGAVNQYYPLRGRFKAIIRNNKIRGATIYKHPGYNINGAKKQNKLFASILHRFKIAFVCSSVYKCQVKKYAELAIAGCLIIGDLPDEDPDFWSEHIVQVNLSMSDDELIEIVNYWMDNDEERISKAERAQMAVLLKYTTMHTAQLIAESINLWNSGFRGAKHNYAFINSCLVHHSNDWCFQHGNSEWQEKKKQKVDL